MTIIDHKFDEYIIRFPSDIKYQIYDYIYCYGIKFFYDNKIYDIIYNRQVNWSRIIITEGYGRSGSKDIPFKEESWWILPKNIEVIKI